MYSTCLYCSHDLGANDVLETLPIGRRVAFNAPTGRLWVVCRRCQKWNLVPFDSRLETIDACEQLFRDARLKFSTDNIGIARLAEGLELVRIGPAERHEFAAWRYGDQFGRRARRRWVTVVGGGVVVVAAASTLGHLAAPLIGISGSIGFQGVRIIGRDVMRGLYRGRRVAVTVVDSAGPLVMTKAQVATARYRIEAGKLAVELQGYPSARGGFASGSSAYGALNDEQVVPALARVLPYINALSGSRSTIRNAVDLIGDDRGMAGVVHRTPRFSYRDKLAERLPGSVMQRIWAPAPALAPATKADGSLYDTSWQPISRIPASGRLALEMLAHEETEREALAGQLALLERQWRDADRVAKIADDLAVSDESEAQLEVAVRRRDGAGDSVR
ncbi:MAG TPA: hypothetical protein VGM77_10100 [Gemmatimonadales bacterium]|jgi:hypothetical protein